MSSQSKTYNTERQLEEQQLARQQAGLPKMVIKNRLCMTCNHPFLSIGSGHRMCMDCRWEHDEE